MATEEKVLRAQLVALLKGGQAHADIRAAMADFPSELTGQRPHGLPYSAWQLVEHMRITLHDLLEFSTNANYHELKWPDEYWPKEAAAPSASEWKASVDGVERALNDFIKLLNDDANSLDAAIPWGKHKENLLREVLLAADHTSYHTGELIVLRRLLGAWKS